MLKKMAGNHVIPGMTGEGEIEMMAAQTGIDSKDILRSINALSANEAVSIFRAIKTGKPLALLRILKILKLEEKALRTPRED
jgi:hypothetical protein